MSAIMKQARRDPSSNAVISTDRGAWEKAKARKARSKAIVKSEESIAALSNQVDRLQRLVQQLLQQNSGAG
jgi:prefoldin subunit 5